MRCRKQPMGGGQCELDSGHPGKHQKTMYQYDYRNRESPPEKVGVFEWDSESQRRLADEHGSRFD